MEEKARNFVPSSEELSPFVKLAIAYLGIMAGFAAIGLTLYAIASSGTASAPVSQQTLIVSVLFFASIIGIALGSLASLIRGRRLGAYLAFVALVLSLFAPYTDSVLNFSATYWLAIPNLVVGILLLKDLKRLH